MADSFATFDLRRNPGMREAMAQCQKVARGDARCALLLGMYGNGKTHLAIATLRGWNEARGFPEPEQWTGWFQKVPDWLSTVKRRAFDEGEPLDLVLWPATAQALMVFDDLGAENATDWAGEQLFRVLDERYDLACPTVITTNKAPGALDPRILSRYREGLVVCKGEDLR
jgi:DNA replication protein DnaC